MPFFDIKVTGRVQGVGFRYYTQKQAKLFGLTGWVKNLPDGSVQVLVQGEKPEIETFVDYLRIGPSMARVQNVSISRIEKTGDFVEFIIRY